MARHYGARPPQGAQWQMGKSAAMIHGVNIIVNRLAEYKKHSNDPYAYNPEEVDAILELKQHAAEDIEFLLDIIMRS